MKIEEKKNSIKYWDQHAELWQEKAYDKKEEYLNFPVSQVRQDKTIKAIEKMAKDKNVSIIDFGCADGELIRALLKKGFTNVKGIDNSEKMIETAKNILGQEMPEIESDKVFFVGDADSFDESEKFDFIIAMGLIEYLLDIDVFFAKLNRILKPDGRAFIESRNKLFNLFSANEHTSKSSVSELTEELKDIKRFSPIQDNSQIEEIVKRTFIVTGEILKQVKNENKQREIKEFSRFPFQLPQFTSKEIENFVQKQGLKMESVIYYHYHPFLPKFEKDFPIIFNRIALLMEPLGYTYLGATNCSAFIALIKKTS